MWLVWNIIPTSTLQTRTVFFFVCPLFYSCIPYWCKFILQLMPYYYQKILHKKITKIVKRHCRFWNSLHVEMVPQILDQTSSSVSSASSYSEVQDWYQSFTLYRTQKHLEHAYRTRFTITRSSRGATGPQSICRRPVAATAASSNTGSRDGFFLLHVHKNYVIWKFRPKILFQRNQKSEKSMWSSRNACNSNQSIVEKFLPSC